MAMELLFLGTGTSTGVPMIGCHCPVCSSDDPHDHRRRPSVLIRYQSPVHGGWLQYLVDTTPELRQQAIENSIDHIDGVFYTHAHADHVLGMDDLRRYNAMTKESLDVYAEQCVIDTLHQMFKYIFDSQSNVNKSFVATLDTHIVEPGITLDREGGTWTPLRLLHGRLPIVGYRVDVGEHRLAYCTDVSEIPEETYEHLQGLDVLVIDALRYRPHPTHQTVDQALAVVQKVAPRQAYFTHISHDIAHAELQPKLPDNVYLAYDGLRVALTDDAPSPTTSHKLKGMASDQH